MNRIMVTLQVTEMGSALVAYMTKSVNHWMYSSKVSLADGGLEWISVVPCTFVATGLNT